MELHGDNKNRQVPSAAVLPSIYSDRGNSASAICFCRCSIHFVLYFVVKQIFLPVAILLPNAKTAACHPREITDFKLRYPSESRPRFRLHSGSRYKSLDQNPALSTSTVFFAISFTYSALLRRSLIHDRPARDVCLRRSGNL